MVRRLRIDKEINIISHRILIFIAAMEGVEKTHQKFGIQQ
jgi:hypothetical protein